ncbi:type I restriction-modification system restriction subunit domain protein [Mycobacterium ulcerans str. Harvey]|uniref:Type I restriction-modification system restriction subunit domain protein n=1 Tax=Mycobacterium ulcerans str. Harvey TaxID=1299332 RepID=A0ABN0R9L0_MYCUL|nr:type I restriction-modification system restriction subunit domain protein [Mycobacterium ulcerans str. Harvey]
MDSGTSGRREGLLITDRTELDEQIEGVFNGINEQIYRTSSGADLIDTLNKSQQWLICSLVHKFRGGDDDKDLDEARRTSFGN